MDGRLEGEGQRQDEQRVEQPTQLMYALTWFIRVVSSACFFVMHLEIGICIGVVWRTDIYICMEMMDQSVPAVLTGKITIWQMSFRGKDMIPAMIQGQRMFRSQSFV